MASQPGFRIADALKANWDFRSGLSEAISEEYGGRRRACIAELIR